MAKMTAAQKRALPASEKGIPGSKKTPFPMNDKVHQRMAISGAAHSFNAGNIGKGTEQRIQAEARRKLHPAKSTGAAKKLAAY